MVNLYMVINIERVSKHSVTFLGQRVVTPTGLEPGQIVPPLQASRVGVARFQHAQYTETSPALYIL